MMQYIAFAIYRDTKRSSLSKTSKFDPQDASNLFVAFSQFHLFHLSQMLNQPLLQLFHEVFGKPGGWQTVAAACKSFLQPLLQP